MPSSSGVSVYGTSSVFGANDLVRQSVGQNTTGHCKPFAL